MTFEDYLTKTYAIAEEEKEVLDILRSKPLDKITLRAAKSSMQTLIENCIGKAKKILQHYNCTIIPNESRDAIHILADCGAIDEEMKSALFGAIGFRNAMIHDYMSFDNQVLEKILKDRKYDMLYIFLSDECQYSDVIKKRIENYAF